MLTQEQIRGLAPIPDDEVLKDIADTEAEIEALEKKVAYLDAEIASIGIGRLEAKMPCFRRDAALSGLSERRKFVAKLKFLMKARKG